MMRAERPYVASLALAITVLFLAIAIPVTLIAYLLARIF